jgi:uncharacterized membrane protein YkvA (DUF1232 family)
MTGGTTWEGAGDHFRRHAPGGRKWRRAWEEVTVLGRMARAVAKGQYSLAIPQIALLFGTLGYVVSPVDGIPDVLPLLGLTDDATLVAATVAALAYEISCFREWERDRRQSSRG